MAENLNQLYLQWQFSWGTPQAIFLGGAGKKLPAAFLAAIFFHALPFTYLWHKHATKKIVEVVTLQNVELIEAEEEMPPAPPPVEVQKPKNAFEFLKMALPTFKKPEAPRDIALAPKIIEPKIAEPDKLIDKKLDANKPAPDIKLDLTKAAAAPKVLDISKIAASKAPEIRTADPSIKLEEVGRRAVAPPPQTPSISLNRTDRSAADVSQAPKISNIAQARPGSGERLVDKTAPSSYKAPAAPLGYQPRGAAAVSLDQARDVARTAPKPQIQQAIPKEAKKQESATLEISKEKVKITGQLSSRKVVRSFVPEFPAWAKARNIEADVAIRFFVSATGEVRDNAVVERTSGYPELDKLAMTALKQWKFTPLAGNDDQWGVITFRYLLD